MITIIELLLNIVAYKHVAQIIPDIWQASHLTLFNKQTLVLVFHRAGTFKQCFSQGATHFCLNTTG